jgi:hypothetical protein
MTEHILYEKYSWFKDDLKYAGPKGSKAQFKGVALLPTISGNGKKYVEEELHRSARTLVGKRVDLNHNSQKVKGDVSWAEFEDGCIEYVMEIHDKEYVEKLRDKERLAKEAYVKKWGRDPIYGVSVEANYRYHDSQCRGGHCTIEPHGIIFNALSLVEDPERPGVQGTTIEEIRETQLRQEQSIVETLAKDMVPSSILKEEVNTMSKNEKPCDCPEGQHDDGAGKCVPDSEPDLSMETLELKHHLERVEFRHAKETKALRDGAAKLLADVTVKIAEVDLKRQECCTRLGETQKILTETEAIAKGALDKIEVNNKVFAEKVDLLATKQALIEALAKLPNVEKVVAEAIGKLPVDDKSWEQKIAAIIEMVQTKFTSLASDGVTQANEVKAAILGIAKLKETIESQAKHIEESDKKIAEVSGQKLKETQEAEGKLTEMQKTLETKDKTLKEMQDQIDTLKLHVSPKFKAKLEEKKAEPNFSAPYTYAK